MRLLLCLLATLVTSQRQEWRIHSSASNSGVEDTYLLDISMATEQNGFAVGMVDGQFEGNILRTTDGGRTWSRASYGRRHGLASSVIAQTPTSAVVNGMSVPLMNMQGLQYTTDGVTFRTINGFEGVDQGVSFSFGVDALPVRGGFAAAGEYLIFNRPLPIPDRAHLAVTLDGGLTWRATRTPYDDDLPEARVLGGSYPSANVFYLAAGNAPEDAPTAFGDPAVLASVLRARLGLDSLNSTTTASLPAHFRRFLSHLSLAKPSAAAAAQPSSSRKLLQGNNDAAGAIWKSVDGGSTFTRVMYTNHYSFQSIECPSVSVCYAVGYCASNQPSPRPGLRIMATFDGGATWRETLYMSDVHERVHTLKCASTTECWATGGRSDWDFTAGHFWHTTNSGTTWTKVRAPAGTFPGGISIVRNAATPSGYTALATAFSWNSVTSVVLKY